MVNHKKITDGQILTKDSPSTTSQLSEWWNVYKNRLVVLSQRVNNLSAKLEDLVIHVFHATRESSPVSKDDEGKFFTIEVHDSLSSLVGAVGEPDLSSLRDDFGFRVKVGWICWDDKFDRPCLDSNHTDRNASEPSPATDDCLRPIREGSRARIHGQRIRPPKLPAAIHDR